VERSLYFVFVLAFPVALAGLFSLKLAHPQKKPKGHAFKVSEDLPSLLKGTASAVP
jgi:hypothetical protein